MTIGRIVSLAIVSLVLSAPAYSLTAVCNNATGRIFGIHGKALGGKAFDEPDAISKATFTLLWKKGEREATIVTQSSGGGAPTSERALMVFDTNEQFTFVVLYESAVWFYSIYPGPKVLMMTSHNNGASIDSGGAVVKSYQARCEIGE
jgi:hypothetical protein